MQAPGFPIAPNQLLLDLRLFRLLGLLLYMKTVFIYVHTYNHLHEHVTEYTWIAHRRICGPVSQHGTYNVFVCLQAKECFSWDSRQISAPVRLKQIQLYSAHTANMTNWWANLALGSRTMDFMNSFLRSCSIGGVNYWCFLGDSTRIYCSEYMGLVQTIWLMTKVNMQKHGQRPLNTITRKRTYSSHRTERWFQIRPWFSVLVPPWSPILFEFCFHIYAVAEFNRTLPIQCASSKSHM